MTNPTNWPNTERPGVPMFPERSGTHILELMERCVIVWWDALKHCWAFDGVDKQHLSPGLVSSMYSYSMACLLPEQIAEMLAGEWERCAQEALHIGESWNGTELSPSNTARHIAKAIRNLGAAS